MILALALHLGCTGGAGHTGAPVDTQAGEDTAPVDACSAAAPYGGDLVGEEDCAAGICEVPAGSFWMGEPDEDGGDRCPPREVTTGAFGIDQHEVTRQRYEECVLAGACEELPSHCESLAEYQNEHQLPAICSSWEQAATFCAWRSGRLPTEAEWERAARGDDGADWAWGSEAPTCDKANFREVTTYCNIGVVDVGSHVAYRSPYGLYDTVGNAWEWVADWYDAGYYRDAPSDDPEGPEACSLAVDGDRGECTQRVMRGGAFNVTQDNTKAATRSFAPPSLQDVNLAFRCAYDR